MKLYDDLGIKPDATEDEIKAAYRKAASKHHPDKGGDKEKFQVVQRAYEVLTDPVRRGRYDKDGTFSQDGNDPKLRALGEMANLVTQLVDAMGENTAFVDVRAELVKMVEANQEEFRTKLKGLDRRIKFRTAAAKRFRLRKGKTGDNLMARILEGNLDKLNAERAMSQDLLKTCGIMLEMLADYQYDFDAAPKSSRDRTMDDLTSFFGSRR